MVMRQKCLDRVGGPVTNFLLSPSISELYSITPTYSHLPPDEWRISRLSRSLEVAAAILLTRTRNASEAVFDSSPSFTGEVLLLRKNPPFIRAHYRTWMEASGHNASSPETEARHDLYTVLRNFSNVPSETITLLSFDPRIFSVNFDSINTEPFQNEGHFFFVTVTRPYDQKVCQK